MATRKTYHGRLLAKQLLLKMLVEATTEFLNEIRPLLNQEVPENSKLEILEKTLDLSRLSELKITRWYQGLDKKPPAWRATVRANTRQKAMRALTKAQKRATFLGMTIGIRPNHYVLMHRGKYVAHAASIHKLLEIINAEVRRVMNQPTGRFPKNLH